MELFEASRYRYVHPPDGDGYFCVGNAGECDGEARIPWNGAPTDPAKVRALDVAPSAAQLRRPRLPGFLGDLPHLESLTVPAALAGLLGDRVPRTLVIHGEGETPVDVLADIRSPLEVLEIAGTGRRFPMTGLPTGLRALRLNGVRAEIDCALLAGLQELDVLNSRTFVNLDAILDIPRVRFVNCGNPFRVRPEFAARGFDVAYA
ncbi:hypothetical protein [Actinoplanes sp. NPDC048796]|uniref:hypothetical protein n=1 Tax=Actinoplanes sp. NPDC048796 TaxID=3155640 RepID=UPI0033D40659